MKMNHHSPFAGLPGNRSSRTCSQNPLAGTSRLLSAAASAALAASLFGLGSCSSSSSSSAAATTPTPAQVSNAGNFAATVFLGDSLTAGYQSGSLLDTAEVHGWAPLFAAQAGFPITQALIAYPGAPATLLLKSVSPLVLATAPGTTTGRDNPAVQVTDLAVPGAFLNDIANTVPLAQPAAGQEQINQLVLGFPGLGLGQDYSQASFAVQAKPTTIFLWAGNNDALVADLTGTPNSMTSVSDFTSQYAALIRELTSQTSAHLVMGNIPDVTLVPYLQPAALILGEYSAATGYPVATLSALFGITAGDYVTPEGLAEITAILAGKQATPLSDAGVLTAAEVVTVQANVTAYNQVIAAQAKIAGATVVDINALFSNLAANGLTINGYTGTNAFLGGFFSLDGIHPTNTGYAVVANTFIDASNASSKTTIADVNLAAVAAADPLWPPTLAASLGAAKPGPGSASKYPASIKAVSAEAAKSLEEIMVPARLRH
jgi:lysophospholipase L1-like esterase